MALTVVMAVTNSEFKSFNLFRNRHQITEPLPIKIPVQEFYEGVHENRFKKCSPLIQTSTPISSLSPTNSNTSEDTSSTTSDCTSDNQEQSQGTGPIRVTYRNRDILNLGANLREPNWHTWNPKRPQYNLEDEFALKNHSVYHRLSRRNNNKSEHQFKTCKMCGFSIPARTYYN